MRQAMPTVPRSGSVQGACRVDAIEMATVSLIVLRLSLVIRIRIFGMFQIPQRTPAVHRGQYGEVIVGWRRTRRPLQGPRIPRIVTSLFALEIRMDQVVHEAQCSHRLKDHSDADDDVPSLPAATSFVRVNSPWHAEQTGNMHEVECQMKADDKEPKVPLAKGFGHHAPGYLWVPIIKSAKQRR